MQNLARFRTTSKFGGEYLRNEWSYSKSDSHSVYGDSSCVRRNKNGEVWSSDQWRNYNFWAPPANIRYGPRPNLILRYGDTGFIFSIIRVTFGPLYRDGPLGPPALPGMPMASYATASDLRDLDVKSYPPP